MIDLGTVAGLRDRRHELHAYCPHCDRWRALDLARLVEAGWGARRLPFPVRCRDCGGPGRLQVRPPCPLRSGAAGWIASNWTARPSAAEERHFR